MSHAVSGVAETALMAALRSGLLWGRCPLPFPLHPSTLIPSWSPSVTLRASALDLRKHLDGESEKTDLLMDAGVTHVSRLNSDSPFAKRLPSLGQAGEGEEGQEPGHGHVCWDGLREACLPAGRSNPGPDRGEPDSFLR